MGALTYYSFVIRNDVWAWLAGATRMQLNFWMEAGILSALFLPLGAVLGPLIFYIGIGLMKDIESLPGQLEEFSIEQCKCYCCSPLGLHSLRYLSGFELFAVRIGHQDPVTGHQVGCDRDLIFTTLQEWYGDLPRASRWPETLRSHRLRVRKMPFACVLPRK